MQFYQYWLIIITVILVLISIYNIIKMVLVVSKNKYPKIDYNDILNANIRNLLISIGLLSVFALVYIMLIFYQN